MLQGKHILITSGPTRAPLDAVRYLSNISTGRFGCLLAGEARRRGGKVTFIYGKGSSTPPGRSIRCIEVVTNRDVQKTLARELKRTRYDALLHAMALLDFEPARVKKTKTSSRCGIWTVRFKPAPKIISQIKKYSPHTILIGFKLETGVGQKTLLRRARRLQRESKADLVLANQLSEGDDRSHRGWLLDEKGWVIAGARGKIRLARLIFSALEKAIS